MPTPTPAPTAAPSPSTRKPREVPVWHVTVTLYPGGDWPADRLDAVSRTFLVEGSAAQAREHMAAKLLTIRRATAGDILAAGKAGIDIETAAGGEGGAA